MLNVTANDFPDGTLEDAYNYCRNPTFDLTGPWCFVKDKDNPQKHLKHSCGIIQCCKLTSAFKKIAIKVTMSSFKVDQIFDRAFNLLWANIVWGALCGQF